MPDSTPVDLTAIRERLTDPQIHDESLCDCYEDGSQLCNTATDIAALVAEVERLRAERDAMTTEWGLRREPADRPPTLMESRRAAKLWAMRHEQIVSRRCTAWVADGEQHA